MWIIFAVELWVMALLGTALLFVYAWFNPQLSLGLGALDDAHWWAAGYVGLFTTFLPTAIGLFFQRYVSPVTVAFLYVLEPVWGAIAARMILGEHLDWVGVFGASLIVLGSIIHTAATAREDNEEQKATPEPV
jgi:drug/metabolite transporter (DMT)-like permease